MSEIKVTFGALGAAQTDIAATAGRLQTQLEDLKKFLAPMVSTWTGEASVAYQVKQRQWDTAAQDLQLVLAEAGRAVGLAHDGYLASENAIVRTFRG